MQNAHATSMMPNLLDDGIVDTLVSVGATVFDDGELQVGPAEPRKPVIDRVLPSRTLRCISASRTTQYSNAAGIKADAEVDLSQTFAGPAQRRKTTTHEGSL